MKIDAISEIEKLIDDNIEESLTLEYKKELTHNKEIAKEMVAFANSDGGMIIYGVATKDKIPVNIEWIKEVGVEERVQNVAMTAVHPILENIKITRLKNPENELEAVYVVIVPKSFAAPHMVNNIYYRRRGSISTPMDDIDVKSSIFGSGRTAALRFEISQNLNLSLQTLKFIDQVKSIPPEKRNAIALIPFQTDAWDSMVASGLLVSLSAEVAELLVKSYRLIHETNSLIEWLKSGWGLIVHTPVEPASATIGRYLPSVIEDRLSPLVNLLREIQRLV